MDQRLNNVHPTLKMKQNLASDFQHCAALMQRQCPTLKQCRNVTQGPNNVAQVSARLMQRSFNLEFGLVKAILNPIGQAMIRN